MLSSLSVVLLAAAPEVAVLSTVPEMTELRFQPVGLAAPVPAVARLQHVAFEDVFGALVPGTRTVVAATLAKPARDVSFASSLWALEAGKPARLLCDRVAFANRPVVSAEGRIFVQRGRPGDAPITVDEVDLRTGKTRELLSFTGSAAFVAGTLGREVLVYRVSATGADLVAVHADALGVRILIPAMAALARDFAVTADRSALVYTQGDATTGRWYLERLDLRTLVRTRHAEGASMALLPTPLPDGRLAFAPAEGAGLIDLEGRLVLAPASKGHERVRAFLKNGTPIGLHETSAGFPAPIGFAAVPKVRLDVAGVAE
jgi:hypothetical protein